jgi:glycosyltransferase involved in cell wall biosynthesis
MKALFCHDHYYYTDGEVILSKGQYHASIWDRYLKQFDHLTVIGRDGGLASKHEKGINTASRENVSFQFFPNANSLRGLLFGRSDTRAKIAQLVSNHDVIILRGTSELGAMAYVEAKRQGKYIVMEVVSCAWDELWYHGSFKAKLYAFYRFFKQRQLARTADACFYVSQKFLQHRYPSNAPLIAAVSDVVVTKDQFYKRNNAAKLPVLIGMIGTLKNKLKGVHVAIKACRILKSKGITDFQVRVLGPGEQGSWQDIINENNLQDYVILDGIVESGEPVLQWLRDLDLYIQPSFQEGLPRAVVEAMAQSLPVIGSDAGGIPELINNELIFKRGNAQKLSQFIEQMINDPEKMLHYGHANYQTAQNYIYEDLITIRDEFWANVKIKALQTPQG